MQQNKAAILQEVLQEKKPYVFLFKENYKFLKIQMFVFESGINSKTI